METNESMMMGRQLRFGNISTIEAENDYVPTFIEAFNAKIRETAA